MLEANTAQTLGVTTYLAKNLKEARSLTRSGERKFDLLITGTAIGETDNGISFSFINSLKIPTILFTSNVDDLVHEKITKTPWVLDYIIKDSPVSFELLSNAIERFYKNAQYSVLIVDDSKAQLEYCQSLIDLYNFKTFKAKNGQEALDCLESEKIDVLITDYEMPIMDGMELLRQVKQKPEYNDLITVCVSNSGDKFTHVNFLKLGTDDFLEKPFLREELYCRLNQNLDLFEKTQQLNQLSYSDFLTKTANRRFFFERVPLLISETLSKKEKFCIAILDIDYFKTVNDTYGHETGDQVLIQLAQTTKVQLIDSDIFARTGGEEFLLYFNYSKPKDAIEKLDKLREAISLMKIKTENETLEITASFGAVLSNSTNITFSIDELIELADKALYMSKKNGRNKVTIM